MKELTKNELKNINGEGSVTAAMVSAIIKGVSSLLDIGRYLGSSLRRVVSKKNCPLK